LFDLLGDLQVEPKAVGPGAGFSGSTERSGRLVRTSSAATHGAEFRCSIRDPQGLKDAPGPGREALARDGPEGPGGASENPRPRVFRYRAAYLAKSKTESRTGSPTLDAGARQSPSLCAFRAPARSWASREGCPALWGQHGHVMAPQNTACRHRLAKRDRGLGARALLRCIASFVGTMEGR
jgi:hypothetical protein